MRVLDPGHVFELDNLRSAGTTELRFYKDPALHGGEGHAGPSTQEVMRAVISRVFELDHEQPNPVNAQIIQHAREIIALFEVRALVRKVEKGDLPLPIEEYPVGPDGHIMIREE